MTRDGSLQTRKLELTARLRTLYDDAEIELWLRLPHPQLAGQSPGHVIELGRIAEVEAIIDRMESGAYL